MSKIREYSGKDITITFDMKRCIHAAECASGLPAVFDIGKKPWVNPDGASASEIEATIKRCPSGALKFVHSDGGRETAPDAVEAVVSKDGPLYLTGDITVENGENAVAETRVALCRCGESTNKPYCDNKHQECGFTDDGSIDSSKGVSAQQTGKHGLRLQPYANGPVGFEGKVTIKSADGETEIVVEKGAFCRCGKSATKPFCDGTHSKVGFRTD